jgi:hypothetical protein
MLKLNTKLLNELDNYITKYAVEQNLALELVEHGIVETGSYYWFDVQGSRFGILLQKVSSHLKVIFFFEDHFSDYEINYWETCDFNFRMCHRTVPVQKRHTFAVMKLTEVPDLNKVKVIMTRQIDTPLKFKTPFRYAIAMLRNRKFQKIVADEEKKRIARTK